MRVLDISVPNISVTRHDCEKVSIAVIASALTFNAPEYGNLSRSQNRTEKVELFAFAPENRLGAKV